MNKPGVHLLFNLIPKVFRGVEVRALFRLNFPLSRHIFIEIALHMRYCHAGKGLGPLSPLKENCNAIAVVCNLLATV